MNECPKCSHRLPDEACGECGWKPGMIIDNATVTVKDAVDGTKRRKHGKHTKLAITTTLSLDDLDPRIRAAVMATKKPGQLIRIISPTEVQVVNR